jgi:FAS-associated factor 2
MSVVMRAVGPMTAQELVAKISAAMTAHAASLQAARAQRQERQATQNLRQEQDSAYERSLAQDRERARLRREQEESARNAEKIALEQQRLAERKAENIKQWRRWRARRIAPDPGMEIQDAIRVSIRMPNGQRVIRKFPSGADMDELYAFVDCYEFINPTSASENGQRDDNDEVEKPDDYEHVYAFRLVSPMPRKVYDVSDNGTIEAVVGKGANLIVEPIEDEDGGDET